VLAKFHLDLSNRLATIHQRLRQTDRQTGHDRQRMDSIGRTVLQTVAKKKLTYFYVTVSLNTFHNSLQRLLHKAANLAAKSATASNMS